MPLLRDVQSNKAARPLAFGCFAVVRALWPVTMGILGEADSAEGEVILWWSVILVCIICFNIIRGGIFGPLFHDILVEVFDEYLGDPISSYT